MGVRAGAHGIEARMTTVPRRGCLLPNRHSRMLLAGIQLLAPAKDLDPRQEHSGMTARQEHSGMTARQEHSGMTARQEHSGMTARQEHSGMTARQERSGMTARQEHSGMTAEWRSSGAGLSMNPYDKPWIQIGAAFTTGAHSERCGGSEEGAFSRQDAKNAEEERQDRRVRCDQHSEVKWRHPLPTILGSALLATLASLRETAPALLQRSDPPGTRAATYRATAVPGSWSVCISGLEKTSRHDDHSMSTHCDAFR
jgi:hypothetical protein